MISLCVITNGRLEHLQKMLTSFAPAYDELCLVLAAGNTIPTCDVEAFAKAHCEVHSKIFRFARYDNAPGCDWPHVDDFGAARQLAWSMATQPWQIWADCDDTLKDGVADRIRIYAASGRADVYYFGYRISPRQIEDRPRLCKTGTTRWHGSIHEVLATPPGVKMLRDVSIEWIHDNSGDRTPNRQRNLRILDHQANAMGEIHFYRQEDYFLAGDYVRFLPEARRCADSDTSPVYRFKALMNLAQYGPTRQESLDYAARAFCMMPQRREAAAYILASSMETGAHPDVVMAWARIMGGTPKPDANAVIPFQDQAAYGWLGASLYAQACRYCGKGDVADKNDQSLFSACNGRITLCHATRGRPDKAAITRTKWIQSASNPGGIDHIFGIDSDDDESLHKLGMYRHVVVPHRGGCVAAWNACCASAYGDILIQLSDDWEPAQGWDDLVADRMPTNKPAVLAVSDGHRKDDLLCMAILNRARYEQQGSVMFAPCYKSVYSDNEFTARAYRDGVVIDARDTIRFEHQHPIFGHGEIDLTYAESNSPDRYEEGKKLFEKRNPNPPAP